MNNKRKKIIFIIFICLLTIIISSCLIFYREFNRLNNPIMAGISLLKINILNKDYVIVQETPKTIIAKSRYALNILEEYMSKRDFKLVEQLGNHIIFENNLSEKQSLSFRVNRYYSIWEWK